MRRQGKRIAWQQIRNSPGHVGDLRTHLMDGRDERVLVASVFDQHSPVRGSTVELFQPVLVGMATNAFTLRGIERGGYVQEWYVESL